MKKYVKPELFFENYELSQHIAACAWDLNMENENVCGFKGDSNYGLPEDTIILNNNAICKDTVESYCYQANGADGMNTFNS